MVFEEVEEFIARWFVGEPVQKSQKALWGDEYPGLELGFTDLEVAGYALLVFRTSRSPKVLMALAEVWHPWHGRYIPGSRDQNLATKHLKRIRMDYGLPKIPAWRVRLALRRKLVTGKGFLRLPLNMGRR